MAKVECVVARTEEVAVSLGPVWVYPTGLELQILVDAADRKTDLDPFGHLRPHRGSDDAPGARLRFGFRFADGTEVTNMDRTPGSAGQREGQAPPRLLDRSGGGHEGHWIKQCWLWSSPPPEQLEMLCEWLAAGIPRTRIELDAAEIARARSMSQEIFPEDP